MGYDLPQRRLVIRAVDAHGDDAVRGGKILDPVFPAQVCVIPCLQFRMEDLKLLIVGAPEGAAVVPLPKIGSVDKHPDLRRQHPQLLPLIAGVDQNVRRNGSQPGQQRFQRLPLVKGVAAGKGKTVYTVEISIRRNVLQECNGGDEIFLLKLPQLRVAAAGTAPGAAAEPDADALSRSQHLHRVKDPGYIHLPILTRK